MSLLGRALAAAGPNPFDNRWFTGGSIVNMGDGGGYVGADNALRISAVWRAVNVLAAAVAVLPIDIYRRLPRGREQASDDPLRPMIRQKPNNLQTSFTWRHHMMGTVILGGNYYAQKVRAYLGAPIEQLFPLDPDRMRVVDVTQYGSPTYEYTTKRGEKKTMTPEDLFHFKGFSRDGVVGVSVLEIMKDTTTLALRNRQQRTTFVKNQMRPSVIITHEGEAGSVAESNLLKGYELAYGGPDRAGRAMVLGEGADIKPFSITSQQAQEIEHEHFLVEEFLRYIGVPAVLAMYPDKTATYASTEAFFQNFDSSAVFPLVTNFEQELTASLYGVQEELFVKLNMSAILRANSQARAAFYNTMVTLGIYTRNEVRELEEMDPLEGLDDPLTPMNLGGAAPPGGQGGAGGDGGGNPGGGGAVRIQIEGAGPAGWDSAERRQAHAIVEEAATQLVRKEVAALQSLGKRYAADAAGWREQVAAFYAKHAELVAERMKINKEAAAHYAEDQRAEAIAGGLAAIEGWSIAGKAAQLVRLALGRDPMVEPLGALARAVETLAARPAEQLHLHPPPASAPVILNRVDVAVPAGPREMRIVGPVEARVTEMPLPPETITTVEQRDRDKLIKQTHTRAMP
jgi:HK97 family phage portal protein